MHTPASGLQKLPQEVWRRLEAILTSDASPKTKDRLIHRILGPAMQEAVAAQDGAEQAETSSTLSIVEVSKQWLTPAEVQLLTRRSRKAVTVAACIHKWRRRGKGKAVQYWHEDALKRHRPRRGKVDHTSHDMPGLPFDAPIIVPAAPVRETYLGQTVAGRNTEPGAMAMYNTRPLDVMGTRGPLGKIDIKQAPVLVDLPRGRAVETIYHPPVMPDADLSRIAGPVKITTFIKE